MAWIKRNLFFVIGLAAAVMLMGAAGFYDFRSWGRNREAFGKLTEVYTAIKANTGKKPSPGNEKIDNIEIAKEQTELLKEWMAKAMNYFQPIAPIPGDDSVTSEMFAPALNGTVRQLQHEAEAASVQLPPQYFFSFTAESDKAVFDSSSLPALAQQLGEVKTIAEILFSAKINELESIQRVPVSPDDTAGQQADYLTDQPIVKQLAVLTPYQVTFRGFSSDIAAVLSAFASSSNGFIVRIVTVQPAAATVAGNGGVPAFGRPPPPGLFRQAPSREPSGMTAPATGRDSLQTVLNEQLLRVTMEVEIVKPTLN